VSCHSPGGDAQTIPFTDFGLVKLHASTILRRVADRSMPPPGRAPALTTEEMTKIRTWVRNGAPKNAASCSIVGCGKRVPAATRPPRRLTNNELNLTLRDLFGNSAVNFAQQEMNNLPDDLSDRKYFDTMRTRTISLATVDAYQGIGEKIGDYFIQNNTTLTELSACLTGADPNVTTCVEPWIRAIAYRAFRRPLENGEVDDLKLVYTVNKAAYSRNDAIQMVVASLVQSIYFVHHLEIEPGTLTDETNVWKLNPFHLASRLSYFHWGSMPDTTLMAAAAAGNLSTIEEVRAQSARLLSSPKAMVRAKHFFKQFFGTYFLPTPQQSAPFLQGLNTNGIVKAAENELDAFNTYYFEQNGSLEQFLLSRRAYLDPADIGITALRDIYGVAGSGWMDLPAERAGFSSRVGFLMGASNDVHPILRGISLRRNLLCHEMPPPPAGVDLSPPPLDPTKNTNIRTADHTSAGLCQQCHNIINPLGYLFIQFDSLGRFRTEERLFDSGGNFTQAVPFAVTYPPNVEGEGESPVVGHAGVVQLLSRHQKVYSCFAKRAFRFAEGRAENGEDACVIDDMTNRFKSGGIQDMMAGYLTPEFLLRKIEP
jgi:hypothetical protein